LILKSKYGFDTSHERSRLMSRIKSVDTQAEIKLRKELWKKGYRYRVNYRKLSGKPDIVFIKQKITIFIDGSFWHGFEWEKKKPRIITNRNYWVNKIEGNMIRDIVNTKKLEDEGWLVLRFWDHDVNKNFEKIIKKILQTLKSRSQV
jgi:DNA mismatch endonuclease (patch repair protein)